MGRAASNEAGALPIVAAARAVEASLGVTGWAWLAHLIQAAGRRYERSLRRTNTVTYDGLIRHLHHALCAGPNRAALAQRLAEKWTVGLIDESQDTDQQQLDIFRAIFDRGRGPGRLILVGDPKQAIYSFRGGDLDAYLSARPTDDARISSLATTYRSAPSLVTALNALFGRPHAFATPDLSYPAATAARRDEDLPLPDDGHGRLGCLGDPRCRHRGLDSCRAASRARGCLHCHGHRGSTGPGDGTRRDTGQSVTRGRADTPPTVRPGWSIRPCGPDACRAWSATTGTSCRATRQLTWRRF